MIDGPHVIYRWAVKSNDGNATRLYGTREQARRAALQLRTVDPAHTYYPAKLLRPIAKRVAEDATVEERMTG